MGIAATAADVEHSPVHAYVNAATDYVQCAWGRDSEGVVHECMSAVIRVVTDGYMMRAYVNQK